MANSFPTFILLVVFAIATDSAPVFGRTFTTVSGVTMEAKLVKLKTTAKTVTAVLKMNRDGREYEFPLSRLRKEDQDWILDSDIVANQLAPGALTNPMSPFYKKPALYSDEFAEGLVRGKTRTSGSMYDLLTKNRTTVAKGILLNKAFKRLKIDESRLRKVEKRGYEIVIEDSGYVHKQISQSYDLVAETISRSVTSKSSVVHVNWIAIIPHTSDSMAAVMLIRIDDWDWRRCTIQNGRVVKYPVGKKPILLPLEEI